MIVWQSITRAFAKSVLRRCIDTGRRYPRWLDRRLANDQALVEFEADYRLFLSRLRSDAMPWQDRGEQLKVIPASKQVGVYSALDDLVAERSSRLGLSTRLALGSAALVAAVALSAFLFWPSKESSDSESRTVAHGDVSVRSEELESARMLASNVKQWVGQVGELSIVQAKRTGQLMGEGMVALENGLRQERGRLMQDAEEFLEPFLKYGEGPSDAAQQL